MPANPVVFGMSILLFFSVSAEKLHATDKDDLATYQYLIDTLDAEPHGKNSTFGERLGRELDINAGDQQNVSRISTRVLCSLPSKEAMSLVTDILWGQFFSGRPINITGSIEYVKNVTKAVAVTPCRKNGDQNEE